MKKILLLFLCLSLTACKKEDYTYSYLMKHPQVLKEQITHCNSMPNNSDSAFLARCELVNRAASDFTSLLTEQQHDPERFGQRIMDAQIACQKEVKNCEEMHVLLAVVGVNSPE